MLDYIQQRIQELQGEEQQHVKEQESQKQLQSDRWISDLQRLWDSSIQSGDYYIEVGLRYRNNGTGETYLSVSLCQCYTVEFDAKDQRRGRSSWWDDFQHYQAVLWSYLHRMYGTHIRPGAYRCDDTELIEREYKAWPFTLSGQY